MKRFALIGVAGFIAPRHLRAIKETGNTLVASMDLHDSVGILDSFFPDSEFFTEPERFERYLNKSRGKIDYLVVCTPNYLHDAHVRMGLNSGCDVICEKPLTVNPWNAEKLQETEILTNKKVYTIQQLRLHPIVEQIKKHSKDNNKVEIRYIASRGRWYQTSWKGDKSKSGGLLYNIGIHLFDLMYYLFGEHFNSELAILDDGYALGVSEFDNALVDWTLSLEGEPEKSIWVNGTKFDLSNGFDNLHTKSYERILKGKGYRIEEVKNSIKIIRSIYDTRYSHSR